MKHHTLASSLLITALMLSSSVVTGADQPSKMPPSPTPEMRQKMAEMHQKMADCLKSDQSIDECHKIMMKECPMHGMEGCPMMGKKKRMRH